MSEQSYTSGTKMGTIGGTLTIFFANITTGDMLKTFVLSAIGAAASFGVSLLLKKVVKRRKSLPPKSS